MSTAGRMTRDRTGAVGGPEGARTWLGGPHPSPLPQGEGGECRTPLEADVDRRSEIGKMMRDAQCVRRERGAGGSSELVGCRLWLFLSWLVARSFGGRDDGCEGGVAGRGADGYGVARGRGRGVVAGHTQASFERGTRGAGGDPGGWDTWDGGGSDHASSGGIEPRTASCVPRQEAAESHKRGPGGIRFALPTRHASGRRVGRRRLEGASAPFGQGCNRPKWGERAGVPPFSQKGGARVRG